MWHPIGDVLHPCLSAQVKYFNSTLVDTTSSTPHIDLPINGDSLMVEPPSWGIPLSLLRVTYKIIILIIDILGTLNKQLLYFLNSHSISFHNIYFSQNTLRVLKSNIMYACTFSSNYPP